MALNYVSLTCDLYDGRGSLVSQGTATFTPSSQLTDTSDHELIAQVPITVSFKGTASPVASLLATDNAAALPLGWAWIVTFSGVPGNPAPFSFFLPFSGGGSQYLSAQAPVFSPSTFTSYLPAPILVAAPTGATAFDTGSAAAGIAKLTANSGFGTLIFQDGTYQIDSNTAVIRNCSNFAVKSAGATILAQAPNTVAKPNNVSGDLMVIADCTDFRVEGITVDGLRDTLAPITALSATASSGQPSVTVAAGKGAQYVVGQRLALFGGLGTAEVNQFDFWATGTTGANVAISSITPGGGAGGGDLITFNANLTNSYAQIGGSAFSDGFGTYAWGGAYLTPYQTGFHNAVAGRTLTGEDQQNGLHLLNCQRFVIDRCEARNLWESPFKCGSGQSATQLTDACSQGTISNCTGYHCYDQGISLWVCSQITITGCVMNAAGWGGIVCTASDDCSIIGNQVLNSYYRVPSDSNSGSGIVVEGGYRCVVEGNIIRNTWSDGMRMTTSPIGFGAFGNLASSTSTYLAAQTAAGTPIQMGATAQYQLNGRYSLNDGPRSEAVIVASIPDGTHVTFDRPLVFSHPAGVFLGQRVNQENMILGNTIDGPQVGSGILLQGTGRDDVKNNTIQGWSLAAGGTGSGIVAVYTQTTITGVYQGGDGTHIEGNIIGGGNNSCIVTDSVGSMLIRGNKCYGVQNSVTGQPLISLKGTTDSIITDNYLSDNENGTGILGQTGGRTGNVPARLVIAGNSVTRTANEGILFTSGDSLTIKGNKVSSCGGHAGINLRTVTRSTVTANVCNSNSGAGIELEGTCTACVVADNICRDDGTGINVTTGASFTQARGIFETGSCNDNWITGNEADTNGTAQIATVGAATYAWGNIISGAPSGIFPAALLPEGLGFTAADAAMLAQSMDPVAAGTTQLLTGGTVYLVRFNMRYALTISNILVAVTGAGNNTGGSTGTFVGLYNSSGTLLSGSSDVAASLTAQGTATLALTTPQPLAAGTFVWAAIMANLGTTQPTLAKSGATNQAENFNLAAASFRFAVNGAGRTTLPGPITPGANSSGQPLLMGVS